MPGPFKWIRNNILLQVFITLIGGALLAHVVPICCSSFFYSVSCTIKDILTYVLPFIVFSYLTFSVISYDEKAPKVLIGIFVGVIASILLAVFYSYGIGNLILPEMVTHPIVKDLPGEVVDKMWGLPLTGMSTDRAMLVAFSFAMWFNALNSSYISRIRNSHIRKMEGQPCGSICKSVLSLGVFASNEHLMSVKNGVRKMKDMSEWGLLKLFVPVIPLYVLGFIMKFSMETSAGFIIKDFGPIFAFNFGCILLFVAFSFIVAANFNIKTALVYAKNMLPATLTGFCTMSSVATLPITIQSEEKNIPHATEFARLIIPTTVNVHAIGDVINVSLSGLALLLLTSHGLPSLSVYACFAIFTCIAQFSCVSVPGGGIIVMGGILQKYLGLDVDSVVLLTSIYFLLEPFLTSMNVAYNGAFTILMNKILNVKKV
ncbi:MAG: dicarboxylate/amino acid:cation symporter [Holosporales bacterium]|nr:dicarboxylate/amino acid:cation symporter [Holosporales bacterium]